MLRWIYAYGVSYVVWTHEVRAQTSILYIQYIYIDTFGVEFIASREPSANHKHARDDDTKFVEYFRDALDQ